MSLAAERSYEGVLSLSTNDLTLPSESESSSPSPPRSPAMPSHTLWCHLDFADEVYGEDCKKVGHLDMYDNYGGSIRNSRGKALIMKQFGLFLQSMNML